MICKNCGNEFEGNYCNNCGQPAATHDIDMKFVLHDLQHGLVHIHGGLFFSAKELFTRPGHAIRDYIKGKRVQHYQPISMLIVLTTFYGLFYYTFEIDIFSGKDDGLFDYKMVNEWVGHHFPIIILLQLPIFAAASYFIFRKQGYNYLEHIILNSFYSTQKIWLRLSILLLLIILGKTSRFAGVSNWLFFPELILMIWTYGQFFKGMPKFTIVWKTFLTLVVSSAIALLLTTLFFMLFIVK